MTVSTSSDPLRPNSGVANGLSLRTRCCSASKLPNQLVKLIAIEPGRPVAGEIDVPRGVPRFLTRRVLEVVDRVLESEPSGPNL